MNAVQVWAWVNARLPADHGLWCFGDVLQERLDADWDEFCRWLDLMEAYAP